MDTNEHEAYPPDCGHTVEEHRAFDYGVRSGELGVSESRNPYRPDNLKEAWLSGHSVGILNRGELTRKRKLGRALWLDFGLFLLTTGGLVFVFAGDYRSATMAYALTIIIIQIWRVFFE